jgi:ABC-type transport system involved in multi-copper enzyme maturation permease subunit
MFAIAWKELQKNILVISAYIVLTLAMALVFNDYLPGLFEEERDMLATNYSLMLGVFTNMVVFGGLMANEKEEDQSNGYEFMRTIPIESWQIVAGKFLSALVSGVIAIVTVVLVTNTFGAKLESKLLPVAYSLFSTGVALVLVAVMYLFAFRLRYSRLLPVVMVTYISAMMLPQILNLLMLISGKEATVEQLFRSFTLSTGVISFCFSVVLFGFIGLWALKIKKEVPAPQ